MAKHIQAVGSELSNLVATRDRFWASLREGLLLFCSGSAKISHAIEGATKSPWSHIAMVIKIYDQWCVLEAVWPHGVTITPLWQYIDRYEGDLVLCRRLATDGPGLGLEYDHAKEIRKGIELLGRDYAAVGLVKEGLHRIFTMLPPETNGTACYCSGLQWLMSKDGPYPFSSPSGGAPSPEDCWLDNTVVPICVRLYEKAKAAGA